MPNVGLRAPWLVVLVAVGCGRVGFSTGELGSDGRGGDDGGTGGDGAPGDGANAGANVGFVRSGLTDGGIGGLAQADAICAQRAIEGSLPGTYVAYLSTTTVNAIDRLAGARGWVRPDGQPFADTTADIAAGIVLY